MPRSTRNAAKGAIMPPVSISVSRTWAMQVGPAGDRTREHVGVAADPLGGGLDDQVGAQLEGPAEIGRGERVVDDDHGAMTMGALGEVGQVRDHDGRVGDGLEVQHPGGRPQRSLDRVGVGRIHVLDLHPEARQHGRQQRPGAAVHGLGRHDPVAGAELRQQRGVDGGHARREREPGGRAMQLRRTRPPWPSRWGCPTARRHSPDAGRQGCRPAPRRPRPRTSPTGRWAPSCRPGGRRAACSRHGWRACQSRAAGSSLRDIAELYTGPA